MDDHDTWDNDNSFTLPEGSGDVIDLKSRGTHGIIARTNLGKLFYIVVKEGGHFCTEVTAADLRALDTKQ